MIVGQINSGQIEIAVTSNAGSLSMMSVFHYTYPSVGQGVPAFIELSPGAAYNHVMIVPPCQRFSLHVDMSDDGGSSCSIEVRQGNRVWKQPAQRRDASWIFVVS